MNILFAELFCRLIENPKPGALTSGIASFGGYGLTKCSVMFGVTTVPLTFLQALGIISMSVGIVVGVVTLFASIARIRAEKARRRYYENYKNFTTNSKEPSTDLTKKL